MALCTFCPVLHVLDLGTGDGLAVSISTLFDIELGL